MIKQFENHPTSKDIFQLFLVFNDPPSNAFN